MQWTEHHHALALDKKLDGTQQKKPCSVNFTHLMRQLHLRSTRCVLRSSGQPETCGMLLPPCKPSGASIMSALQYETLTSSQLTQLALRALKAYPDPVQGELRLLCRSENATFVIETPTQRYALRLHRGHYHDQQAIESELMWLDALRAADIQAPEALYDRQGERVQKLQLDGEHRYAVIFHWMDGEMPTTDVSPEAFYQLGEITAQLHQHSRQWQAPAAFKRIIWNHETMVGPQGHWGDWRAASGLPAEDHPLIEAALSQIQQSLV
ncbi:phosphotransferase [Halopseudomonas pachastrellae]|nr:phosphotransferase [Halopseudomonas pachastrellae]